MTDKAQAVPQPPQKMTSAAGAPIGDNQNSLTAGERGPMLLQDVWFLEKLAHFDREVIPERRVHAKGSGAYGTLTITQDISRFSKASLFAKIGKETPVFLRFSTVAGERGAADAERDVRGFSLKFYTDEGNWDLVGNNTPVFFIRDPLKFPDFIHTQKRDPATNMRNPNAAWDFWSLHPESLHQVTILMSDRGLPRNYREINGYGSHTFSLVNAANERFWVKFHFKSLQGITHYTDAEAGEVVGRDRESAQRDLQGAIEAGNFPRWRMCVQVMPEKDALTYPVNPFDVTKVWSHRDYPLIEVGVLELYRNPVNYFAEVEQVAMNPANVVPGIGFSPDKMLQGRLFSYGDTQRYRLGVNHNQIPVNAPRCPFHHVHRDGLMRVDGNNGAGPNYQPNTVGGPVDDWRYNDPPLALENAADRFDHRLDSDYYSQAGALFRLMTSEQQQRLFGNIGRSLGGVSRRDIQIRQIRHFYAADPAYGAGVAEVLGIDLAHEVLAAAAE